MCSIATQGQGCLLLSSAWYLTVMYGSMDIKIEKIEKQICFWKRDEATFFGLKVTQIINQPQVKGNKKKISVHKAGGNIVNLIIKLAVRGALN